MKEGSCWREGGRFGERRVRRGSVVELDILGVVTSGVFDVGEDEVRDVISWC